MSLASVAGADTAGRDRRASGIAFAAMVALIAIAPFVAYPFFIMNALCFALFACAFNLLIGYANLLSLGHAMFLGLASYVCAHAAKVWGLEPVSAIALGVAASAFLGFVTGALAIRSVGIYFAMITVAFSQMVFFFCVEAPFTHGEDGIQAVPQGRALGFIDLSNPWVLYAFVAAVFPVRLSRGAAHGRTRPLARFSKRSAKTSRAPSRSAIARCSTSSRPSPCRPRSPALPARRRRSSPRTRR